MAGIFPPFNLGAATTRDAAGNAVPTSTSVTNVYVPGTSFTSTGLMTSLLTRACASRWSPEQTNAIISELLALAEAFSPDGHWVNTGVTNVADNFRAWLNGTGTGTLEERVTAIVGVLGGLTVVSQASPLTGDGTLGNPLDIDFSAMALADRQAIAALILSTDTDQILGLGTDGLIHLNITQATVGP